jgi:hypothetical protein
MREVQAHEVRAICEAGGEVQDGDLDTWSFVAGELTLTYAKSRETRTHYVPGVWPADQGPWRVTEEPTEPVRRVGATDEELAAWVESVEYSGVYGHKDIARAIRTRRVP